ncbi:MAG: lipid-A-disaccharide synthase [Gammaproteobacteria bacterium]
MRLGIVAGEPSGDRLGADLIAALRRRDDHLEVEGIGGARMQEAGCKLLYPMDRLAVMGVFEVLGRYRELAAARSRLAEHFLSSPPDLFVGIDAPEFNLGLEERLRAAGVRTVHYVSPQVWAWRPWRVRRIARAVDLMLVLFPFEENFYHSHGIPVKFVGHPLADEIADVNDNEAARAALGLSSDRPVVGLLPGSRSNEWRYHVEPFLRSALELRAARPDLQCAFAASGREGRLYIEGVLQRLDPEIPIKVFEQRTREVIAAAHVVLTVSGTASLETLLVGRPMVVSYRMSALSYLVARLLVRAPYFSLPNLLAGRRLVPEILQGEVEPRRLAREVSRWLDDPVAVEDLKQAFSAIRLVLRRQASHTAAEALFDLAGK